MAVLEQLAKAGGAVVSRTTLFDAVWPGGVVSDDTLTQCIVELRKAFGDSPRDAKFIETIPRKGFRLVTPIRPLSDATLPAEGERRGYYQDAVRPAGRQRARIGRIMLLAAGAVGIAVASYLLTMTSTVVPPSDAVAKSVAVLPFVDMSPDGDQEYLADGLAEELINQLTQLDGLLVTGRTSSFYFKGRNEDLHAIGERLNVDHIVEGSVRKSANQLRITTQLIDVHSGFHVWSETYDRPFDDVFTIQDDIAQSVATALSVTLRVGAIGKVVGGTDSVAAFEQILQGNAAYSVFDDESYLQAIEHFTRATEIDPDFAIAWERLSDVYRNAWLVFGREKYDEFVRLSQDALARATELAPQSPIVLTSTAAALVDGGEWLEAQRLLDSMVADDGAQGIAADLLTKVAHIEAAVKIKERSLRLDPLHAGTSMYLGHLYAIQGRNSEALDVLERGYALGDYLPQLSTEATVIALGSGDVQQIRYWLSRAVEHELPGTLGTHAAMYERFGDRNAALSWLRDVFDRSTSSDYHVAVWASYYGDTGLALRALRRSPDTWLFWMPLLRELRREPEFGAIVRDLGLVDYWREYGWGNFCRPDADREFECT